MAVAWREPGRGMHFTKHRLICRTTSEPCTCGDCNYTLDVSQAIPQPELLLESEAA
jgi:hypothetical protein